MSTRSAWHHRRPEGPTDLAYDHIGALVVSEGFVYYLTDCCRASAKGSMDGTVCRACYELIDPRLGDGWAVTDADAWARWERSWAAAESRYPSNAEVIARAAARIRARAQEVTA